MVSENNAVNSSTSISARRLRYRNILLRDLRTVKDGYVVNFNIGTTAHAPATLAVLKKYLPGTVKITLWADAPLAPDVAAMMKRRFPEVPIVYGDLEKSPPGELLKAVEEADLFLVSSGAGIAGTVLRSLKQFRERTGMPVAAYAIGCTESLLPVIGDMDFAWFRDPVALEMAKSSGCPVLGWAPDAVFDFDAADTDGAEEFMKEKGLLPGRFICCIPGQRFTPRWDYFDVPVKAASVAANARYEEHDNAPLREIIRIAVAEYGLKVLICPEQITEIALIRPLVYDRLPPEIQKNCVVMDKMWSPDLALGVYRASRGVFGVEMHSQVMAVGNGVPGVLLRHPRFGSKSEMWRSIGIPEWCISTESPEYASQAAAVAREILGDPAGAAEKLRRAGKIIEKAAFNAVQSSFFVGF